MLAYVAGGDVVIDVRCHSWPGVVAAYKVKCLLYSMVAGRALVVGLVEEGCAEVVVVWNVYAIIVFYKVVAEGKVS